ncbi:anhydro-N-acetylmuramic acid kinase [Actimicrobium antarcticum]|uniref:Anhydro-N-acetylmuramic acid kinase n=2 Tax=Actimicrobium antarcticum TaxID=1051899 RepID=A0ABP7SNS2_9BURK
MSGTSLDGVDGVLATIDDGDDACKVQVLAAAHIDFAADLRTALMALQTTGQNEIHHEAMAANQLARCYADCVARLLESSQTLPAQVVAIGAHGQTIRHRPELGYTRQINNGALLAELTGIDVIADFRSRDMAAGGQGAPLVPAFHHRVFADSDHQRVIANIGGISNISVLAPVRTPSGYTTGYDTGPGNMLLDLWIHRHRGLPYDESGNWAATGQVHAALLDALRDDAFFQLAPPKSTGRDLFNAGWLDQKLTRYGALAPADVQATLTELTATTLADAILLSAPKAQTVFVCGGGAFNTLLMSRIGAALAVGGCDARVQSTNALGIPPDQVEALAFAWLAMRFTARKAGNLSSVTGASGARILGALYPA